MIAAFVLLWNKSEVFRNFWIGLFDKVMGAVQNAWSTLQPALQNLGQKLMELYEASKPILNIIGKIAGVIGTVFLGTFVGAIQGVISALTPLTNALSSLISFATNIVRAIVALFKGDFSGACNFASSAIGDLKNFFINGFNAITSFLRGFAEGFMNVVGGALSAIGIDASSAISSVKETVSNGLNAVKGFFGNIMGAAADTAKEKLSNIKNAYHPFSNQKRSLMKQLNFLFFFLGLFIIFFCPIAFQGIVFRKMLQTSKNKAMGHLFFKLQICPIALFIIYTIFLT